MLQQLGSFFRSLSASGRAAEAQTQLQDARRRTPIPVIWLFGKTQSGKTSIIRFLTHADNAEIGNGFQPCTRFSRHYPFPSTDAPLMSFLDTRGLDEPGYNVAEDLEQFDNLAHLVIVTAKVMDHAQENVIRNLEVIRKTRPSRPVILALTCLHEAYPQQQHPQEYPFRENLYPPDVPDALARSIAEQHRRFGPYIDTIVPIDLTNPEEGYNEPNYGGEVLKEEILYRLPDAYRQTLLTLDRFTGELGDAHLRRALPLITGYSYLAAAAGAIPIPFLDLVLLPGLQMKMVMELGKLYGQQLSAEHYREIAATLGTSMMTRQAVRELAKFIPFAGVAAGAALAGASTYALGRAFCYYYQHVKEGHVPSAQQLKHYFQKELTDAQHWWQSASKDQPK
jgi:uncharacterized protein (DUF697 family)